MSALFAAIIPGWTGDGTLLPFPKRVQLALRFSLLVLIAAAIWRYGRSFKSLPEAHKTALLEHLAHHPRAAIRGLVMWWKLAAMVTRC